MHCYIPSYLSSTLSWWHLNWIGVLPLPPSLMHTRANVREGQGEMGISHAHCPAPKCPQIMARKKVCFHFSAILKKLGGYTLLQKKTFPSPQYKNTNEGPVPYPTYAKRGARKVMERNFHHPSLPSSAIQHTLSCFLKVLYFQEYNGIVLNSGSLLKF